MDEVPWGGEFTDDDAPPPPYETNSEPFTWGPVATNDANVASMDVRRRHEQADYAELEQFGGSDEEEEYELIQHERALAAERAAREAEAASAAWSAKPRSSPRTPPSARCRKRERSSRRSCTRTITF